VSAHDPAPLLRDATALHTWLLHAFEDSPRPTARHLCALSTQLVDAILLALHDRDRRHQLATADDALLCLRLHLRLAGERGQCGIDGMWHALRLCDTVGRQIGGWQHAMDRG
jgi:hypothetical protein